MTMIFKCVMSAPTKEELIKMINEYFHSASYIITDDDLIYNTKTKRSLDCLYLEKRNRHCVYSVEEI